MQSKFRMPMYRGPFVAMMAVTAVLTLGALAGCEEDTPAENVGEAIEESGERIGNAVKELDK